VEYQVSSRCLLPSPPIKSLTVNDGAHAAARPPAFDAEDYKRRNVIERNFNVVKQWRGLATRYDKLAIVYRAGAVLRAITIWLTHLSDTP
jgi:transposase